MTDLRKPSYKIQKKVLGITLSCILGMCVLISIVSYYLSQNYLKKSLIQSTETNLKLLSDTIDTHIYDIDRMVQFLQTSTQIAKYIKESAKHDPVLSVNTYNRVSEEYNSNPSNDYMTRLAVITEDSYLQIVSVLYSSTSRLSETVPKLPYFNKLLNADGYDFSTGFVTDPFYRKGKQILPIIRPITYQFNAVQGGYLFLEISDDLFKDALKRYTIANDSSIFLTLSGHTYKYDYDTNSFTEWLEPFGKKEIFVTAPLSLPDCYISQNISNAELFSQLILFWVLIGSALICISSTGIILAILMNKGIEDEKQKQDLEYKMLQSQINPHFIYNTLNSIKWMAVTQGADGISEMTTALARLLKSISKGTSLKIPIGEELTLIEDYFTIQSYRYGGTISLTINVEDEEIKENSILKFTLQPIVENAIFHGIEPKGAGKIEINAVYENSGDKKGVRIDVKDDGVGMSGQKASMILEGNDESSADFFKEIGISNVHRRLKYEFGKSYGITVESKENEYTVMSVHLPYERI